MERSTIKLAYRALVQEISSLNERWPDFVLNAEAWALPILQEQETPKSIEPVHHTADEAILLARKALAQFDRHPTQHPATVMRLPGWILLSEDLVTHFEQVNQMKDDLKSLVQQKPPGSRAALTRELFPGISMLQAYRHIFAYRNCPRQIIFSWAGHTTSSEETTVRDVMEIIEESRLLPPSHLDIDEWNGVIDNELRILATWSDSTPLLYRKPIAPHPRAMLYFSDSSRHDAMVHANLPIFLTCAPGNKPTVKGLGVFDYDKRSAKRKDSQQLVAVIERLGLYARK